MICEANQINYVGANPPVVGQNSPSGAARDRAGFWQFSLPSRRSRYLSGFPDAILLCTDHDKTLFYLFRQVLNSAALAEEWWPDGFLKICRLGLLQTWHSIVMSVKLLTYPIKRWNAGRVIVIPNQFTLLSGRNCLRCADLGLYWLQVNIYLQFLLRGINMGKISFIGTCIVDWSAGTWMVAANALLMLRNKNPSRIQIIDILPILIPRTRNCR